MRDRNVKWVYMGLYLSISVLISPNTRIYKNVSNFRLQILLIQKGGLEANSDKSLVASGF